MITLDSYISGSLKEVSDGEEKSNIKEYTGRLGPKECCFDISSNVGTIVVDSNRLDVSTSVFPIAMNIE